MTDDKKLTEPDRNDAEREQSAEDAPTPLVEDGDTACAPDHDDGTDDGGGA